MGRDVAGETYYPGLAASDMEGEGGGYQYFQLKDGWGPWDGRPSRMGSGLNWAAKVVPGKNLLKFQSKNNFLFISEHFAMFHTIRYKSPRLNLTQKVEYSGKI